MNRYTPPFLLILIAFVLCISTVSATTYLPSFTPLMTSNTAPSGNVSSASGTIGGGYEEFRAFNYNNTYRGWLVSGTYGWLQIQTPGGHIARNYTIYDANCNNGWGIDALRAPKNFQLWGSNDGSSWTPLDTQSGITWSTSVQQAKSFEFSNTNSYTYYRLNITLNNGGTYTGLGELYLYEAIDDIPPGAIQGLTNDTTACEEINFTWTNPADADYNGAMVWLNDVTQTNLTGLETFKVFSGLTGGTPYTFSTKTFDTVGNVNATFANHTATPTTCTIAPVANFTTENRTVCGLSPIQFNDTSLNSPTNWTWDYSLDGEAYFYFSYEQNATWTPPGYGTYNIRLTATNSAGSSGDNEIDYITVNNCNTDASISANATCQIGIPLPVQFGGVCEPPAVTNYWDFGDGNTSSDQNPLHVYEYYGTFVVNHTCTFEGVNVSDETYITAGVINTYCPGETGCEVSGGGEGGYHPSAYAGWSSTEVVTAGFIGVCGMLVIGLIGRKE